MSIKTTKHCDLCDSLMNESSVDQPVVRAGTDLRLRLVSYNGAEIRHYCVPCLHEQVRFAYANIEKINENK